MFAANPTFVAGNPMLAISAVTHVAAKWRHASENLSEQGYNLLTTRTAILPVGCCIKQQRTQHTASRAVFGKSTQCGTYIQKNTLYNRTSPQRMAEQLCAT